MMDHRIPPVNKGNTIYQSNQTDKISSDKKDEAKQSSRSVKKTEGTSIENLDISISSKNIDSQYKPHKKGCSISSRNSYHSEDFELVDKSEAILCETESFIKGLSNTKKIIYRGSDDHNGVCKNTFPKINDIEVHSLGSTIAKQFHTDIQRDIMFTIASSEGVIDYQIKTSPNDTLFLKRKKNEFESLITEDNNHETKIAMIINNAHRIITDFSKDSVSKIPDIKNNRESCSADEYKNHIEVLSNSLSIALSYMVGQPSGNALWNAACHAFNREKYMLSVIDDSYLYWNNIAGQEDGSVRIMSYFQCSSYKMTDLESSISYRIEQPISVEASVLMNPKKLNSRSFGDIAVRLGELESIELWIQ